MITEHWANRDDDGPAGRMGAPVAEIHAARGACQKLAQKCLASQALTLFCQVVARKWPARLGDQANEACRAPLTGLAGNPSAPGRSGDDAGHFDSNFDYVAVLDFADSPWLSAPEGLVTATLVRCQPLRMSPQKAPQMPERR
jgi:hypothetical protein